MQIKKLVKQVNKNYTKIYRKFYKLFYKGVHKEIKKAVRKGEQVAHYNAVVWQYNYCFDPIFKADRDVRAKLTAEGFYVRKFLIGQDSEIGEFRVSFGSEIENQKKIDEFQRQSIIKSIRGVD